MIRAGGSDRARLARFLIASAAWLVPRGRREEWKERWRAELAFLDGDRAANGTPSATSFALGAWPDALAESVDAWRDGWSLGGIAGDVQFALRRIRRSPVASLSIVVITGLGAAAGTGIFSLIDAVLLRTPPGLARPDELLQIGRGEASDFDNLSFPNYRDLRDALAGTVDLAAFGNGSVVFGAGAAARVAPVQFVSSTYFSVTGARVHSGVGFSSAADRTAPEAILSEPFAAEFSPALTDRQVIVNGRAVAVVGVADPGFIGTLVGAQAPAMWLSLAVSDTPERRLAERGWSWLWVIGRRRPDVSFASARAAIEAAHARLAREHRSTIDDRVTVARHLGLRPPDRREAVRISSLLMAAAVLLWIVAAANGAGLHLARAVSEARAIAVQIALGASRARVLRGLLVEHAVLAAAGGVAAWVAAQWVAAAIQAALPYDLAVTLRPDARTLAFAFSATILVGLLVSLLPLWTAASPDVASTLRHGLRSGVRERSGAVLVSAQVALATLLLMSAGLLGRSLHAAAEAPMGFDSRDVLVAAVRRQPEGRAPALIRHAIRERVRGVPAFVGCGLATTVPLSGSVSSRSIFPAGSEYSPDAKPIMVITAAVDRGFFETLRIPLIEGGLPDGRDRRDGTLPAIVSAAAVRQMWPDRSAQRRAESGSLKLVVSGVVGDIRMRSIREPEQRIVFLPLDGTDQMPAYVLVRTHGRQPEAAAVLRQALAPLGADILIGRIEALDSVIARSMSDTRVAADLAAPFAAVAILLAAAGLYGVSARRAFDRRREFAIRIALGATAASVSRQVVLDTMRRALPGLGLGLGLAAVAARALRSLLFGVGTVDPVALALTLLLVVTSALVAALIPARRASRVQPHAALRGD